MKLERAARMDRAARALERSEPLTEPPAITSIPEPYSHIHPPVRSINELVREQRDRAQRAADWVSDTVGSWRFIAGQSVVVIAWAILNTTAWVGHWDPYPFIFMNLIFSVAAAFTTPMILMSQNRQSERDRLVWHNDYMVNQRAEAEIRAVLAHLAAQEKTLAQMQQTLAALTARTAASEAHSPGNHHTESRA